VSLVIGFAFLSYIIIIMPMKEYFKRKRPHRVSKEIKPLKYKTKDPSFPSGHTYLATVNAVAIGIIYGGLIGGLLMAILAILVGFSRVYMGVHFLTDVFVAYCLAIIVAYLISIAFPLILNLHEIILNLFRF